MKSKQNHIKPIEVFGEIKVSGEKPPVWNDVCVAFGINPVAYFTYGDTIFNPSLLPYPPPDIIAHERLHMKQQMNMLPEEERTPENHNRGAALWWGKFLRDPAFRIDQESRAYGKQYAVICKATSSREMRFKYLQEMGGSLSGPLYNNCIGKVEAIQLIEKHSKGF
jgi:hypothetical protein